jgi:hypothetical protein
LCANPSKPEPLQYSYGGKSGEAYKLAASDSKICHWISRETQKRIMYFASFLSSGNYRPFGDSMFRMMLGCETGRWTHILANCCKAPSFTELDERFLLYTDSVDSAKFNSADLIRRTIDPKNFVKSGHQALIDSDNGVRMENSMPKLPELPGQQRNKFGILFNRLSVSDVDSEQGLVDISPHSFIEEVCAGGLGLKRRVQLVSHTLDTVYTRVGTSANSKGKIQSGNLGVALGDMEEVLALDPDRGGFRWKRCVVLFQDSGPKDIESVLLRVKPKLTKIVEVVAYVEFNTENDVRRIAPLYKRLIGHGALNQSKAVLYTQNLLLNEHTGKVLASYCNT